MKSRKMIMVLASISATLIINIQAQPFRHFALPGGVVHTINCDTTGVSEGASGANVTWTIALTPHDTQQFNNTAVSPASTPYAAKYPSATNAIKGVGKNIAYTFYRVAGDSLYTLGFADSLIAFAYSPPELAAISSLAFGNSFANTYAYRESTTVSGVTFISKFDLTRTVTFDGTGRLVLPWKTFSHAMRYKAVSSQTDSSMYSGILASVTKTDATSYSWIDTTLPDNTGFSITRTTTTSSIVTTSSTEVSYSEPVNSGVVWSQRNGSFGAADAVVVSSIDNRHTIRISSAARLDRVLFTAYDLSGRTVATAQCSADASGPSAASGSLSSPLTKGVYLYSLKSGSELFGHGKVLVR